MKAAIYARYSTDMERDASIEDQVRLCTERAEADGLNVAETYTDRATSGATILRSGIQVLLADAQQRHFDILFTEALDRLSRDQEDIAGIFKRLSFAGVKIITLSEGEIGHLHISLKCTMNALFLKDLADKTRRGLRGRVEAGKSGGGKSYGYDVVKRFDAVGDAIRGDLTINQNQAAIVTRIFAEYSVGKSPKAIAAQLNAERVPGPTGRSWGQSTINGNRHRGTGILNNELYIGRLVWNRLRYIKDPKTGKRVSRLNPEEEWITQDVADLAIVEQSLWDRVKTRQGKLSLIQKRDTQFWTKQRPRYLLSGLIKCRVCGGGFSVISQTHIGCAHARDKGTCTERRSIKRTALEDIVLDGLKHQLMDPELCKVFADEYVRELTRLHAQNRDGQDSQKVELDRIDRDLEKLVDAICAGIPADRIKYRMVTLEARKSELEAKLEAAPDANIVIHPKMGRFYRERVAQLADTLRGDEARSEATEILRSLIDTIKVQFDGNGKPQISIQGSLAGILSLSQANKKAASISQDDIQQINLVAGVGFEPTTFRL